MRYQVCRLCKIPSSINQENWVSIGGLGRIEFRKEKRFQVWRSAFTKNNKVPRPAIVWPCPLFPQVIYSFPVTSCNCWPLLLKRRFLLLSSPLVTTAAFICNIDINFNVSSAAPLAAHFGARSHGAVRRKFFGSWAHWLVLRWGFPSLLALPFLPWSSAFLFMLAGR